MSTSDRPATGAGFLVVLALGLAGCAGPSVTTRDAWDAAAVRSMGVAAMHDFLAGCRAGRCDVRMDPSASVDSVRWDGIRLTLYMNRAFAQVPIRERTIEVIRSELRRRFDRHAGVAQLELRALGLPIEELVPNAYRSALPRDPTREPGQPSASRPLVRRIREIPEPVRGLRGRHVALWQSHGWYYERALDRWEWQRARLFQTVEDILPTAFVLPYLAPMLERAGATVWMPRERDLQDRMEVVDDDGSSPGGVVRESGPWRTGEAAGFGLGTPPYRDLENPFTMGRYRSIEADPAGSARVSWEPVIHETGDYAVYVSWARSAHATAAAKYSVHHAGGTTRFEVDQRMAPATWVYLGTFRFAAGAPAHRASVSLSNEGEAGTVVTADAVRFGGGMGIIERGGKTSGRPRWAEAARYAMQYAGMPDSLVYNVTGTDNDYVDDYRGRAEWVNYLRGAPNGPNAHREAEGLGVPIDLSLAFHTDAGITRGDTTVGTLMIYSSEGAASDRTFPDRVSRFANRDLADMIQTQVVTDIRALHDADWTRRGIWDSDYSEAVRPNVPSALLELLSHQNFADMRLGLDPRFRFSVSRAIYKALVRFIAGRYGEADPVIQPLAPTHLEARVAEPGRVLVRWRARPDPLEPSADPTGYVVYSRLDDGGFDEGRYVTGDTAWVRVEPRVNASFRVAAVNDGGESAPSETVSAAWVPDAPRLLVVTAFDRLSAPASVDFGVMRGFTDDIDHGVADGVEISFVGSQKEFDADVPWRDDDDPGHGASYGDRETVLAPGNTFDYAVIHGRSALAAGWSYDTMSDESVEVREVPVGYDVVDLVLGEERETTPGGIPRPEFAAFPERLTRHLVAFALGGGSIFVSGAYVGSELERYAEPPSTGGGGAAVERSSTTDPEGAADPRQVLARDVLHVALRAERAVRRGDVAAVVAHGIDLAPQGLPPRFAFRTDPDEAGYAAESPDALEPVGEGAATFLRYAESNMSAGIIYRGRHASVTLGFPFETLVDRAVRDRFMASILAFLHPEN